MYREEITQYSQSLSRDMHIIAYGHAGLPFLAFPTQDSPCTNYEEFGMIDCLKEFLENGQIRLFVVDSVDKESWSEGDPDKGRRAWKQELYFRYITDELMPMLLERTGGELPMTTGLSMGANHALLVLLRRPDLFAGCLSLSGVYDSDVFFGGWMNDTLYMNSPERFLPNMPADHPYVALYNQKRIILCVGQGAWEEDGVRSLKYLQSVFAEKGIRAWCDFWGYDVNHDWPWWFKQMHYFLPILLEERNGK